MMTEAAPKTAEDPHRTKGAHGDGTIFFDQRSGLWREELMIGGPIWRTPDDSSRCPWPCAVRKGHDGSELHRLPFVMAPDGPDNDREENRV